MAAAASPTEAAARLADASNFRAASASGTGAVGQLGINPCWFGSDFSLQKVAEKSRELAEARPSAGAGRTGEAAPTDTLGKVFINASSGFANVHQSVWKHTIGGYQVLHKWLDDRRKAGRSLSPDDITHWLRVYAALQATQKLMQQVDAAIEANGGWPGAFSQSHPPPDAATLAAEQMAQKDQLKAQKKAATASKKIASSASPTGATSLFDFDDDLDALAAAAGAPPRPKSSATPASKAAGGPLETADITDGLAMCAIRSVLLSAGIVGLNRDVLIRAVARELGFDRLSPALKQVLSAACYRAVRRGIAANTVGQMRLLMRYIDSYATDQLNALLLTAIRAQGGSCSKIDAASVLARFLGFARTGSHITDTVNLALRSLRQTGQIELVAGQIRVLRQPVTSKG